MRMDGVGLRRIGEPCLCGIQPNGVALTDDRLVAYHHCGDVVVERTWTINIAEGRDMVLCRCVGRNGQIHGVGISFAVCGVARDTIVERCSSGEIELQYSSAVADIVCGSKDRRR